MTLLGGCASAPPARVRAYWGATTKRLPRDSTFAWSIKSSTTQSDVSDELKTFIREKTEEGLVNLGYRKREGTAIADYYVSSQITTGMQPSDAGPIDTGSLVIDVVSGADGRLIWQGWAEGQLDPSLSPEARRKRLEDAVKRILEQFRPG